MTKVASDDEEHLYSQQPIVRIRRRFSSIETLWRDVALAEALVCRPDGKRLFKVVVMLMPASPHLRALRTPKTRRTSSKRYEATLVEHVA